MASRTIKTGDDVDSALTFLGRQERPPVDSEAYFLSKVQSVIDQALKDADEKRFNLVKELMDDKNKAGSISKLKELFG